MLVAAEAREFDGLLRFCTNVGKTGWGLDWARSAVCRERQFWMIAHGAGWARAAEAVKVAIPGCEPDVIVSMGFCGALDDALSIGEVFVATAIQGAGRRFPVCQPRSHAPYASGVLASIDHVAGSAVEKRILREDGASAVEMEAAGVAARAAEHDIPLFCVRSVTDLAGQTFVTDFNGALRSDGHFATIRILSSAFGNPGQAFPELIRLRGYCRTATRSLGEFIAGCRF